MIPAARGERSRFPALDYAKAAAIVAVAASHATPFYGDPGFTPLDAKLLTLTSFHVPTFLLVSGFLYSTPHAIGWSTVAARLRRLIPPYLVASAVALASGLWQPASLRRAFFGVVTGSAIGTYYFIPVLAGCIVLLPFLSRLGRRALLALALVLAVYAEMARLDPAWRVSTGFFWEIRDPLLQFHLGHFVLGLIAGRSVVELRRLRSRFALFAPIVCGLGVVGFVWLATTGSRWTLHPLAHTAYMLSVVGALASLVPARPVPAAVRFLSDATLAIYLYHSMLHRVAMPYALELPPLVRIAVMTFFGLAVGAATVVAGRRLLGARSRTLLGA